ncbi:type IV secretion system protein VirB8 [Bradyrhizobium brasilense]|uniref:Type IV secretion system protein virB8 n=2 Tax=Bradyrhizobium brasilense TaxID=1419277 RepID=A0A1G7NKP5_9BRAD|nr:type IV secretion system protein [Bradyrhizobium brasilense]MCC8976134.1 virB8 family protein [Bradyrhizobium brasilense]SDF74644.1 type IV secretion system protein VirB8 [Bradyrhizobium brasilense]
MIRAEAGLKDYFEKARRWEQDALVAANRSRRFAWIVAGCSCVCTMLSVTAIAVITPLKTIEPFLVRVDNATGIIDTPMRLDKAEAKDFGDANRRFYLGRFVRAYEGYSQAELKPNFDIVSAMSSTSVQAEYSQWISSNNAGSPQHVYGANSRALVEIKSIQLTTDQIATVRYVKSIRQAPNWAPVGTPTHWVATIQYKIMPKSELTLAEQLINPIRFTVLNYRNDPEAGQ